MIYVSAVYADKGNTLVTGTDADGRTETVPADYTVFRRPDDGPIGFVNNGGKIGPYVAPKPAPASPHLNGGGLVRFATFPVAVAEAIKMIGAQRVTKGRYRGLHEESMPSSQYSATASILDARPLVWRITARTETYTEVSVTDLLGVAQDPAELTIETKRVIY